MNEKKEELFNLMMMLFSELEQGEITKKEMIDSLIECYKK